MKHIFHIKKSTCRLIEEIQLRKRLNSFHLLHNVRVFKNFMQLKWWNKSRAKSQRIWWKKKKSFTMYRTAKESKNNFSKCVRIPRNILLYIWDLGNRCTKTFDNALRCRFSVQVSWIRKADLAILTSGRHVYTRWLLKPLKMSFEWNIFIRELW